MNDFQDLRHERKVLIREMEKDEVEKMIKLHPAVFSEIFYERVVNNLYLDSIDLENYRQNVDGDLQRFKIRIRWYGKTFGLVKNPILEIKIKNNEFGKKLLFPLKEFVLDKNFSEEMLKKILSNSALPEWVNEKIKFCHLSLLNSYRRKYFSSSDKKCRITLDWDLKFFRIKNKNNLFKENIRDREKVVVELKYFAKDYENAEKILSYFPNRLSAHSKYVVGINSLNL